MAKDSKLTIGLVVVVGLLAMVAIIISAVSLSKNMPPTMTVYKPSPSEGAPSCSQGQGQGLGGQQPIIVQVQVPAGSMVTGVGMYRPPMGSSGRIYSLAVGHDYGSHEYLDDAGYLSGFAIGISDLVCEAAKIDCRIVWDHYSHCWSSQPAHHAFGGKGLHAQWYDGCAGWYTTIGRSQVFQFSQPYLKEPPTHFFVLSGKSFDTSKSSLMNAKIVYLGAWASDEKCMARQTGVVLHSASIIYAEDTEAAIEYLSKGYDAIFTTASTYKAEVTDGRLKIVGPEYSCMIAGNAVMSRKDNDLPEQWNRGFLELKTNGRFKKFCESANAKHIGQGSLDCIYT